MKSAGEIEMEITTTEFEKQPSGTLPLLSRIDRLETAMRHLEMKQCSSSSGCSSTAAKTCTSEHQQMEMALKETRFKGSLLERIKTLENHLFQLRLRVESDKLEARSRTDLLSSSRSFPIFMMNHTNKKLLTPNASMIINNVESQSTMEVEEEDVTSRKEDEDKSNKQQKKKKKKNKAINKGEREKIKSHNWPYFRMLGC